MRLAATTSLGASLSEKVYAGQPQTIGRPVILQTPALRITLDGSVGTPARYLLAGKNLELAGDDVRAPIEVRVCRKNPWSQPTLPAKVVSLHQEGSSAVFEMSADFGGTEAVGFRLHYAAAGSRLTVSLEQVVEKEGFELLEVRLPALVTVRKQQSNAWMAHGDAGGALIEVASAKPSKLAPNQFRGDILSTLPVLMAGDAKVFCVLLNAAFMDGGAMSVSEDGCGAMGTVQGYRVDGLQCADLSSPAWNEDIVARRPDGELYNSRSWTGENSYILGLAKYVRHGALDRVAYTCKRYKLPGTTHIDVLTYYAIRNDWDRQHPASGYTNLAEGKYKVLDAFHELGIDVSSEAPRYPSMGKGSFFCQDFGIRPCQVAVWGDGMRRGESHPGAQQMFYGGGPRYMTRYDEDRLTVAERFYLEAVPWMLLHRKNILGFEVRGNEAHITLEGAEIDVSLETGNYSAVVNGVQVASENWIACPLGSARIVFYSTDARTLRHPIPAAWDPQNLKAVTATKSAPQLLEVQPQNGEIVIAVAARSPIIVS